MDKIFRKMIKKGLVSQHDCSVGRYNRFYKPKLT